MRVDLAEIREYFPELKCFLSRLTEKEVELMIDKYKMAVDKDKVLDCVKGLFTIVAFGKNFNKNDINIATESVENFVVWLGFQNIKDTMILMNKMNIKTYDEGVIDKALKYLYDLLDNTLTNDIEIKCQEIILYLMKLRTGYVDKKWKALQENNIENVGIYENKIKEIDESIIKVRNLYM